MKQHKYRLNIKTFRLYCGFIRVCRKKLTSTSYTKHWESWAQTGQMIGWGRGSAQNASRFSAMARDGDGRGRDLVDMRVR